MALVQRYDSGRLSKATRTGAGGARVPASIARTGIQVYQDAQGNTVREYRAPDVVFAPESLASLASVPVTIGHPGAVDSRNWRRHAVGHVTDAPPARRQDGTVEWLDSAIVVQDAAALERIERGDLVEVSMGYVADVVPESGVTPTGERYDAVQRGITFNHLALLPAGKARAGSGARLRLDSTGNAMTVDVSENEHGVPQAHLEARNFHITVTQTPPQVQSFLEWAWPFLRTAAEKDGIKLDWSEVDMKKVKIDGVEFEFGSESHISALDARQLKADAANAEQAKQLGELKAKLDATEAELVKAKAVDVAALVQDELAFRAKVASALPADYAFAGKTREQVRADAVGSEVMAAVAKLPEGERAGYVSAHLELKLKGAATPVKQPLHEVKSDAKGEQPAKRKDPVAEAYAASWSSK